MSPHTPVDTEAFRVLLVDDPAKFPDVPFLAFELCAEVERLRLANAWLIRALEHAGVDVPESGRV